MAKKKTKNTENTPENTENTPVVNNETAEETATEETATEETATEETATEETATEEVAPEEVAPQIKEKSAQATFEELIAKTPYVIYQNGVMICHSSPYLAIKTEAKYFEINFRKFSYQGIEVKHT
jgi:hypothetical protein